MEAKEGKTEIEITPEMIEAGLDELWNHSITEPTEREMRAAVKAVFLAMIAAHPKFSYEGREPL
jgi:hypothetical protein